MLGFLLTAIFSLSAQAYIPEWPVIASRAADQHGKSGYQIEQEVTFKRDAEVYAVKETWLVLGEGNMRLTLEGRGNLKGVVQGSYVYDGPAKFFVDANQVKNQRLGEDWLEPLFHFRSGKYLRQRLVNLKVAPQDSLRDRPPLNFEGEPNYKAPSFIRMSRAGGSLAWAISATPASNPSGPTLWIEQDQFVVRKFKGASQVTLRADDYAKFEDGFWYPRARTYDFGGFQVQVQTLNVKSIGKPNASTDSRFKAASLVPAKDGLILPDADGLREFYLRFR